MANQWNAEPQSVSFSARFAVFVDHPERVLSEFAQVRASGLADPQAKLSSAQLSSAQLSLFHHPMSFLNLAPAGSVGRGDTTTAQYGNLDSITRFGAKQNVRAEDGLADGLLGLGLRNSVPNRQVFALILA
ncbi:hypothetical protein AXG93_3612s1190 [Marchantia polymorpha subsp. ruderalis]|uniref:Uncharacterized protein n=1 Tax=Marchantia polymorpha subsp. ruderalis TaxID=1480154 RepID=A0A176WE37_MARPO|nr:hypothetical protein AXG93_3612s1190 [Marchantia polymorpha subsp. ruderalis]